MSVTVPKYLADEDESETLRFTPSKTADYAQISSALFPPDERPITPLRNKMVYDVVHSSLDFRDGKTCILYVGKFAQSLCWGNRKV